MRCDAAEFVPGAFAKPEPVDSDLSAVDSGSAAGPAGESRWRGFSADAAEFVPGVWGGAPGAAESTNGYHGSYSGGPFDAAASGLASTLMMEQSSYIDVETFLTPQLLAISVLKKRRAETEEETAPFKPGKGGEAAAAERAADAAAADAVAAALAADRIDDSAAAAEEAASEPDVQGDLSISGRRLTWLVPGHWEELLRTPQGSCLRSPPFEVAGVSPLQLALFPRGGNLTADGFCSVGVFGEEKTKLKFEVFLDAKSSGTKVMLGKTFSCDFRRPRGEAAAGSCAVVGVEVHENLLYTGFC
eukprot:TRINITY_DN92767_c0_g1_i1.p1 TRINITY_DN92767_c0_g1~~TRINITY_DN92767_c0_g1_i1.p1  ORF type:complete len:302 (+),score=77.14 TRINITY_DN92767_c0_g1_i1:117-1022(+)